jgi:biopolymer transport protein ExbD
MSMNVSQSGQDEAMCDVNTTPLIDVMLVLLVMLIVTLPPQTHAVKLDLPPPQPTAPKDPPQSIYIDIDPDGTIVWNNEPVAGIQALDQLFSVEAVKDPQPQIHLRPSGLAKYDVVANVMASAQRNHMVRMGFTNVAQFAD